MTNANESRASACFIKPLSRECVRPRARARLFIKGRAQGRERDHCSDNKLAAGERGVRACVFLKDFFWMRCVCMYA